jgi:hypothetical protein
VGAGAAQRRAGADVDDESAVSGGALGDLYGAPPPAEGTPFEHLETFAEVLRKRIRQRWDNMVVVDGPSRVGKSSLGMQICELVQGDDWPLANTAYSADDIFSMYSRLDPGDAILYDEAVLGLLTQGGGRDDELRRMVQALSIIGERRLTAVLCLPDIQQLDSFVKYGRAQFWIHVYTRGRGKIHRQWRGARYRTSRSFMPYDTWDDLNPIGFRKLDRRRKWKDYEAMKHRKVLEFLQQSQDDTSGKMRRCPECGIKGSQWNIQIHRSSGRCPGKPKVASTAG